MRRALASLSGLVAGIALLISLKSAPGATRTPAQVAADAAGLSGVRPTPTPTPTPTGPYVPIPGTPGPGVSPTTKPASGPTKTASTPKPTGTTKPPGTQPPGPGGTAPPSFVGDAAFTEFGYVTVAIVVQGGQITDVIAQELPGDEPRSISISDRAGPILRSRALAAQGANFDTVSGATWTSDAYKVSLRSAMQKAGLA